jgi:phosphoenolpyruvate carboxylase
MTAPQIHQNPDIQFLGGLLGEVIRDHGGDRLFDRIEAIRSASVDRHRGVANVEAGANLDALSLDDTLAFLRGFMLFSLLANLAEDRGGVAVEPDACVKHASRSWRGRASTGAAVRALAARAHVVPVLTAHPDRGAPQEHPGPPQRHRRADDAARRRPHGDGRRRDRRRRDPPRDRLALADAPAAPHALVVQDEIETALTYMREVFLPVLPRCTRAGNACWAATCRASCGWATGSAATATATRSSAPTRCATRSRGNPKPCSVSI